MAGKASATKVKTLKVFELVRDGAILWQTDAKLPAPMVRAMGWASAGEDVLEVERPLSANLLAFKEQLASFGFELKRLEQRTVVAAPTLKPATRSEGELILQDYLKAKDAQKVAEALTKNEGKRLQEWLVGNGAPKDTVHPEARIAQIGTHKVHNSWVRGRETPFDKRDHSPVQEWAANEGCANELVNVVIHRTISYEEYLKAGVPDGFEKSFDIDPDMYEYYAGAGAIPRKLHETFEARGNGYYSLKIYDTKEAGCPECGTKVNKTQKFCGECGTKL